MNTTNNHGRNQRKYKRVGRPPSGKQPRTEKIQISLSPLEKADWEQIAREWDVPLGLVLYGFLQDVLCEARGTMMDLPELEEKAATILLRRKRRARVAALRAERGEDGEAGSEASASPVPLPVQSGS